MSLAPLIRMSSEDVLTDVVGRVYLTSPSTVALLTTTVVLTLTLIAKRLMRDTEADQVSLRLYRLQVGLTSIT